MYNYCFLKTQNSIDNNEKINNKIQFEQTNQLNEFIKNIQLLRTNCKLLQYILEKQICKNRICKQYLLYDDNQLNEMLICFNNNFLSVGEKCKKLSFFFNLIFYKKNKLFFLIVFRSIL